MKANAPERIWINSPQELPCGIVDSNSVEYSRTDAFMKKAKEWFIEHVNIPQDVATNEDGEPLADSYIEYAKARLDAANEMFENFKTYIEGE